MGEFPEPQQARPVPQQTLPVPLVQHVCPEKQQCLPQRVVVGGQNGSGLTCCAPRPREARPRPMEANMPPPTTPLSSRKAWRRGIGLAIIRDMSSNILLLLLTTPPVRSCETSP